MDFGFGLIADPLRKRPWGHRPVDPAAVADAIEAEFRDVLPEVAPLLRRSAAERGGIVLRPMPIAGEIRLMPSAGSRLLLHAETGALGPGYHAWLCGALRRAAAKIGFAWREDPDEASPHRDPGGYFADADIIQLKFRFREQVAVRMGRLLAGWGTDPALHLISLPGGLRPAGADTLVCTLRGPRRRVFAELARGAGDTEAEAIFPWWHEAAPMGIGIGSATAVALAEALLWTCFPWRAPLDADERAVGEAARALLNRAGPGEAGDMPVDELETLLAATAETAPREDGPGYLRGPVTRSLPGGWEIDLPGHFLPVEPDEHGIRGWWFGGREVHLRTTPGAQHPAAFDAGALLARAPNEIAFVQRGAFHSGRIAMHHGPGGSAPELEGKVEAANGTAQIWVLFRGADDSAWVLETFRSLRPEHAAALTAAETESAA